MRFWASQGLVGLLAGLLILGVAGCGASETSEPGTTPSYQGAIEQAPARLAQLYENEPLLDGGEDRYEAELEALGGYPVVINNWASWCGPCRSEFPIFQRLSKRFLDDVAFLGVDSQESSEDATAFLNDFPVPYPSIRDPDGSFQKWAGLTLVGLPNTVFIDWGGEVAYVKQGPYTDDSELREDITKYALR